MLPRWGKETQLKSSILLIPVCYVRVLMPIIVGYKILRFRHIERGFAKICPAPPAIFDTPLPSGSTMRHYVCVCGDALFEWQGKRGQRSSLSRKLGIMSIVQGKRAEPINYRKWRGTVGGYGDCLRSHFVTLRASPFFLRVERL